MKRYSMHIKGYGEDDDDIYEKEDANGDWISWDDYVAELAEKDEEIARLRKALVKCMDRQVKIQDLMRQHNYKIDDLKDPVQVLYFAIYTELCEVDAIAREALGKKEKEKKGKCICAGLLNFELDAVPNPDCPIHGAGFSWGKE